MSIVESNQRQSEHENRFQRGVDKHLIPVFVGVVCLLGGFMLGAYSRGLLDLNWFDYLKLAALMFAVIGFERLIGLLVTIRTMKQAEAEAEETRQELGNAAERAERALDRDNKVSSQSASR